MINSVSPVISRPKSPNNEDEQNNKNILNNKNKSKFLLSKLNSNKSDNKIKSNKTTIQELENQIEELTFKPKINKRSEITPPRYLNHLSKNENKEYKLKMDL